MKRFYKCTGWDDSTFINFTDLFPVSFSTQQWHSKSIINPLIFNILIFDKSDKNILISAADWSIPDGIKGPPINIE